MTMITTTVDDDHQRENALLRAVGFDKLSAPERELALRIANMYDLDVFLKHVVLIDGGAYITRDGLLHVAHKSGVFDGIEVTKPTKSEDGQHWECEATVYRTDKSRPFRYPGRYPMNGRNAKYGPEMAIKVAEVMTLRRAFDVAAPVIEERWADEDAAPVVDVAPPASLAERVMQQVAQITGGDAEDATEGEVVETSDEPVAPEPEPEPQAHYHDSDSAETGFCSGCDQRWEPVVEPEPEPVPQVSPLRVVDDPAPGDEPVTFGVAGKQPSAQPPTSVKASEPKTEKPAAAPHIVAFVEAVKDIDKATVKRVAKEMYPDAKSFHDLSDGQTQAILDRLAEPAKTEAAGEVALCGEPSPYTEGATCTQDAGHGAKVPHRAGIRESW